MKKTIAKQVTIDKELYDVLLPYMDENGIKLSSLIRVLLIRYMKENGVAVPEKKGA